jgi:recombinational DNA repair protein (RecF pathway)
MGKGDTHANEPAGASETGEPASVFEEPATLREPAAPSVPRVVPLAAVPVIPLSREGQAPPPHPETLQEAREATDALLHEILEEEPTETSEPLRKAPPAPSPAEEDWPAELHPLPWSND